MSLQPSISYMPSKTPLTAANPLSAAASTRHSKSLAAAIPHLIYAGGTFGSYGKPLATLPASVFLPLLTASLQQQQQPSVVIDNSVIKDSSQLSISDLVSFYQLILQHYSQASSKCPDHRAFVLITGTDTLSYLGAFLAEAFAGSDICIVLTASMRPLLDADNLHEHVIDAQSDAWGNLTDAIALAAYADAGVYVAFGGEHWPAQTVQKIHSHDLMAFTGHSRAGYPANSYVKTLPKARRQNWIDDRLAQQPVIDSAAHLVVVATVYCVPNNSDWLVMQLRSLLSLAPMGIMLIGYGAGNVPYSAPLATLLDQLYQQGHLVVCTTQCPYGGVSEAYAAGSWQYAHQVISAGRLTISAIYARLLWLHLAYDTPARRRQRWAYMLRQT